MAKLQVLLHLCKYHFVFMGISFTPTTSSTHPLKIQHQNYKYHFSFTSTTSSRSTLAVLCTFLFRLPPLPVAMVTGCATACPIPWQRHPVHHSLWFFPKSTCDVRRRRSFWTHHLPHSMLGAQPPPPWISLRDAPPSVIPSSLRSHLFYFHSFLTLSPTPWSPLPLPPPWSSHRERDMNPEELWVINPALCRFLVINSVNWTLIIIRLQRRGGGGGCSSDSEFKLLSASETSLLIIYWSV